MENAIRHAVPFLILAGAGLRGAEPPVDFARDVQPILANRCYDCHGAEKAKGKLRLTSLDQALHGGESGEPVLTAGQSGKSLLIERVTTDDPDDVMPQKGERLTPAEIGTLKRWIDEGALWPKDLKHWAYVKPVRPAVPPISLPEAVAHNPIDHFVLARLAREHFAPSPPTDKSRWLRRVSLDLVGLPPTLAEIEAFLADDSDRAYERVVDRLLASPQYGERWARPWLDLARYADSHGFMRDDLCDIWPYRDWVIRAMNADMPFDQFTVWQLAGDLLPATGNSDPLIATGFHRTVPINVEAGADQEESRVNQIFDRVNTTAAVWLGSTLECAQCHNHKYDPFSQKEYYQLFAYFNNTVIETDLRNAKATTALKFTGPYLTLPDPENEAKRAEVEARIAALDREVAEKRKAALDRMAAWEDSASRLGASEAHPLEVASFESLGGSTHKVLPDRSVLLIDEAPDRDTYVITATTTVSGITGFKLEALTDPSLPGSGPGRSDAARPDFILNQFQVSVSVAGGAPQPVKLVKASASVSPAPFGVETALVSASRIDTQSGWGIGDQYARDHWAVFTTASPLGTSEGATFTFTLVQNFGGGRMIGRLRLSALTGEVGSTVPADVAAILRAPKADRTPAQTRKLTEYFLAQDKQLEALRLTKTKLTRELSSHENPRTLVMREREKLRPSNLFKRGNFLDPGEPVQSGIPAVLHASPSAAGGTRLDLARWLVSPENPLVARVTVNRWWAEFFGEGLVRTPEDFGVKGDAPTHPELLDWLAVEFMENGWSMKHVHRLIALSATYRQSSRVGADQFARDDRNRWLARGPRFRLDAETIRDNVLAAAGLLSLRQFGPPVRPLQPSGIWENKIGGERVVYEVSRGEDAWRRGIYTVWKRGTPYPSFVNFDATARNACTVRRSRSNTPLQALTLLNDAVYVEAALALARRALSEFPDRSDEERIRRTFQLCLARLPSPGEFAELRALLEAERNAYRANPQAAARVVANKPPPPAGITAADLAAWYTVAVALLNLDEMITKG